MIIKTMNLSKLLQIIIFCLIIGIYDCSIFFSRAAILFLVMGIFCFAGASWVIYLYFSIKKLRAKLNKMMFKNFIN